MRRCERRGSEGGVGFQPSLPLHIRAPVLLNFVFKLIKLKLCPIGAVCRVQRVHVSCLHSYPLLSRLTRQSCPQHECQYSFVYLRRYRHAPLPNAHSAGELTFHCCWVSTLSKMTPLSPFHCAFVAVLPSSPPNFSLYRSYHRLIGAPPIFPLPLHVRVHAVFDQPPNTRDDHAESHTYGYTFDVVPLSPTDPDTLLQLLSLRCVPAVVRVAKLPQWPLRKRLVLRMATAGRPARLARVEPDFLRPYAGCRPAQLPLEEAITLGEFTGAGLSLIGANCWDFARDLEHYLTS